MRKSSAILWSSFIFGSFGAVLFFSLHDPVDLSFVGPLEFGRKAGYGVGFLLFWGLTAGSSWLTLILRRGSSDATR